MNARRGGALSLAVAALALNVGTLRAQWLELAVPRRPPADSSARAGGKAIYGKRCASCHGEGGGGDGPVAPYLWPRPRDLGAASYMLRTTTSGELPTDEDLFRTITLGMNGTAMPAWGSVLSVAERWQVVFYIKTLAPDLFGNPALDPYRHVVQVPAGPRSTASLIADGRRVYEQAKCGECHGAVGRGDGGKGADLKDDRGFPSRPLDMSLKWRFKGGRTVRDFYLRLTNGLDGTPMPSYAKTLTDEQRWALATYSISLTDYSANERAAQTVLTAVRRDAPLPTDPEDPAWDAVPEFLIPLSGQATFRPRWQIPSVTDLAIRVVYDDGQLALRLAWDDPTPDTLPGDSTRAAADGWSARADETFPVVYPDSGRGRARYLDAAEVVLPAEIRDGARLPHFVYGDVADPVDLWRWRAGAAGASPVIALRAAGAGRPPEARGPTGEQLAGDGRWKEGRWTVVIRRSLTAADSVDARPAVQFIPVAFHIWDGGNGETGLRMALSSWYFVKISPPVPATRYLVVLLVMVMAAVAEYGLVRWTGGRAARGELTSYGIISPPRREVPFTGIP